MRIKARIFIRKTQGLTSQWYTGWYRVDGDWYWRSIYTWHCGWDHYKTYCYDNKDDMVQAAIQLIKARFFNKTRQDEIISIEVDV